MQNQLIVPECHIVFHDKTMMEVSQAQVDAIAEGNNPFIRLNGQLIARASIAKILTHREYLEEYPQILNPYREDKFEKYESIERKAIKSSRLLKLFIQGVQRHIDEQGGLEHASQGSKDLLERFQKKLLLTK
jgi:hypothetical protein